MATFKMGMETTYCGIKQFYENVATLMGYEDVHSDNVKFDPTKIYCSPNIAENIYAYYRNVKNADNVAIGLLWLSVGAEVEEAFDDDTVVVKDGFVKVE